MNFFLGILIIALGTLVVMKSEWLLQNFGRISWFEQHLGGEGGSRLGYKLIGLVVIFFGLLTMSGLFKTFMGAVTSPLVR